MKTFTFISGLLLAALFLAQAPTVRAASPETPAKTTISQSTKTSIYSFRVKDSEGNLVDLSRFKGKTVLIVNVASQCGYTKQYIPLEALYEKYKDKGLVILGFPCNQFGEQEPGTNAEIQSFCKDTYGVTFPVYGKIDVNGDTADPLYKYLRTETGGAPVRWNFNKFLISKKGEIVRRYVSADSMNLVEQDILSVL